jgi:hypothetical protein
MKLPPPAGAEFSNDEYRTQSVDIRSIKCDHGGSKSFYLRTNVLDVPMGFRAEDRLPALHALLLD